MTDTLHAEAHPLADAHAVEKELTRLWREMGTREEPLMRARVLTLVAVSPEARENEMADCLAALAERHPARTLLLLLGEEQGEAALDATATILCSRRSRHLCAEQVRLHARGAARARLSSAVRSLLSPDLPRVLWWTLQPDFDHPLLASLAGEVDRVLVDSATLAEPAALLPLLPGWQGKPVVDLNWLRLASWRGIIAGFFDGTSQRGALATIDTVAIRSGRNIVGAWMLAGWLASRLDWQLHEATEDGWALRGADGKPVRVHFERGEEEGDDLGSVTLQAGERTFRATREAQMATCEAGGKQAPLLQQVVHLTETSVPALLSHALDRMEQARAYDEALRIVRQALEEVTGG